MTTFTSDQWIILALVFVLGLLIGAFLSAGGRRKWKTRYREESDRRIALEREQTDRDAQFAAREREWREQDSLRSAALKDRPADRPARLEGDADGDGVRDSADRRPTDDRRA